MRRNIASAVICRMEQRTAAAADGSQDHPTSMLVVDEASFVMPQSAAKATGPDVASVNAVTKLLKLHRDKGMAVVLATQRQGPPGIRSCVTGLRLIGKFTGEKAEEKMLMDSIVKQDSLRATVKKQVAELPKHHFLMVKDDKAHQTKARGSSACTTPRRAGARGTSSLWRSSCPRTRRGSRRRIARTHWQSSGAACMRAA